MRNIISVIILVFILLLPGCSKKKEEVIIKKLDNQKIDSTVTENKKPEIPESSVKQERKVITPKEVISFLNKNVVVSGYVADVVIREKVSYLNFDKKYPKNPFSAVIFSEKFKSFGDINRFKNKKIEVEGVITTYKDKPQIILNSPEQIKIITQ